MLSACGKTCGKLNGLLNIGKVRWSCCLSAPCIDCQCPLWHVANWHKPPPRVMGSLL